MKNLVQYQLEQYKPESALEELNALKEISQEIVLYGLSQAGFFQKALFCGGTCLRILHQLDRFSEDLDFSLKNPESRFDSTPYLKKAIDIANAYGYEWETSGKIQRGKSVQSLILKDKCIKKTLSFKHLKDVQKKIQIKIEMDINPPSMARWEQGYGDFPMDFMMMAHDLPSLLAGKCHALLCRPYIKGRDWYDYLWHTKKGHPINAEMLASALMQWGPWKGKSIELTETWLKKELNKKIQTIDWKEAIRDISRFLPSGRQEGLNIWSNNFFAAKTAKLALCRVPHKNQSHIT